MKTVAHKGNINNEMNPYDSIVFTSITSVELATHKRPIPFMSG